MPHKQASPDSLAEIVVQGMLEKKAQDVVLIDLRELTSSVTDIMVICHGDSERQTDAIAQSVEKEVKKITGENPFSTEGGSEAQWILIDYIDVVVHIFKKGIREFYQLEDLWADGKVTEINSV